MKKILGCLALTLAFTAQSQAAIICTGTVLNLYKWSDATTLSMKLLLADGTSTMWIRLPSKSDESLALTAYALGKPVSVDWNTTAVTSCTNGWADNTLLMGYFQM